jgi:hypothetical protein
VAHHTSAAWCRRIGTPVLGQDLSTGNGALNRETRPVTAAAGALVTALGRKQTAIEGPTLGVVLRPLEDFFDGPFEPYTLGSDG